MSAPSWIALRISLVILPSRLLVDHLRLSALGWYLVHWLPTSICLGLVPGTLAPYLYQCGTRGITLKEQVFLNAASPG